MLPSALRGFELTHKFKPDKINDAAEYQQYWGLVEDFTRRDLTFSEDSLNAFAGIITYL
jgi:hypothetical protein